MKEFIATDWQEFLSSQKLASFDQLWDRELPWFEEPNYGRSKDGWSGVCKLELDGRVLFLKKQQNFYSYSLRHPLGITVAQKEYANIALFNKLQIPCMETVYFGIRKQKGKLQAMIMTEGLEGYIPFEDATQIWESGSFSLSKRRVLIREIADFLRAAHQKEVMHNSLYPKHIFIEESFVRHQKSDGRPVCRFIDMEKARQAKFHSSRQLRDLDTLQRRTSSYWSRSDRLYFLLSYMEKTKVDTEFRTFLQKLRSISKK